ncbi:MAG: ribose-phosphate diphosphokinase [Armatimonadota bacterium]
MLHEDPPVLFALQPYRAMADAVLPMSDLLAGSVRIGRFANDELYLMVETPVKGMPCIVLAGITPPDDHLLETLLLCHTLRKEGAREIIAVMPYLAYMRQENNEPWKSDTTAWIGQSMGASRISKIITLDIHSREAQEVLPFPVRSLSSAPLFAAEIHRLGWHDATLVAPDEGAILRCEAVRSAAGLAPPVVHLTKERTAEGVNSVLRDPVGPRAIIIDDILDTGGTLIACCTALQQAGTREIIIMVTHGLFTGSEWQRLWDLGVVMLYCTDTVPDHLPASRVNITVLPIAPILATAIQGEEFG